MIRLKSAILCMAVCFFAPFALAQDVEFTQDSVMVTVADELFGSPSTELEFSETEDFAPKAKLIATGGPFEDARGTKFVVNFRLTNATFAERVSRSDLMWAYFASALGDDCTAGTADDNGTTPSVCPLNGEVTIALAGDGGAKGDTFVDFEITIAGTGSGEPAEALQALTLAEPDCDDHDDDATTAITCEGETRKIVFTVPNLDVTKPDVRVWATIRQDELASGHKEIAETILNHDQCGGEDQNMGSDQAVACKLVEARKILGDDGITIAAANGMISLEDRTMLVDATGKALAPQRIALATVSVTPSFGADVRDRDGDELDAMDGFMGELDGNLFVSVTSESFRTGDSVYIGDPAGRPSSIDGNIASNSVDLGGNVTVYYVPNGMDPLGHGTEFHINARTEFADSDNKTVNAEDGPMTANLNLHGIMPKTARAYAIAPLTNSDLTNLRITCESDSMDGCNVFLDCRDDDGQAGFDDAGTEISAGGTAHMTKDEIAAAVDLAEFNGRLACEVLSTADISVQVLTRSGGALVNNTYVGRPTED